MPEFVHLVVFAQGARGIGKVLRRQDQQVGDLRGQLRQDRLEVDGEHAEGFDAQCADLVQALLLAFLLGQFPGLVLVDIDVDLVGQRHDVAHGTGVIARFI